MADQIHHMADSNLKIFYLKKRVLYPYCTLAISVPASDESRNIAQGDRIVAFTIRSVLELLLYRNRIATLAEVLDSGADGQSVKMTLKGISRVRLKKIIKYTHAAVEIINPEESVLDESVSGELRKKSQELIFLINVEESDRLIKLLNYIIDPNQMTDFIANYFVMDFRRRYRIYTTADARARSLYLMSVLDDLIATMTKKRKKAAL